MQVVNCEAEIFIDKLTDAIKNERHQEVFDTISFEVGSMLKNNKPALMRAFELSDIKVRENLENSEILSLVYDKIQSSPVFTQRLIEFIVGEKQEYSEFIGLIIKGIGMLVGGIGKAIAAGIRAKSELEVAKEKVKTEKEVLNKSRYEFLNETIAGKDKSEQAQAESKRQLVLVSGSGQQKVTIAITVSLVMFTGIMLYLTYKSRVENA
jgi:hypothetical protein